MPGKMACDHFPIKCSIGILFYNHQYLSHKYELNRIKWKIFRTYLLLPQLNNPDNTLNAHCQFYKDVDDALHHTDPNWIVNRIAENSTLAHHLSAMKNATELRVLDWLNLKNIRYVLTTLILLVTRETRLG